MGLYDRQVSSELDGLRDTQEVWGTPVPVGLRGSQHQEITSERTGERPDRAAGKEGQYLRSSGGQ